MPQEAIGCCSAASFRGLTGRRWHAPFADDKILPWTMKSVKKPVASLVSLQGVERESLSLSLDPTFMKIIRRARTEVRRGEVYSLNEVKEELLPETDGTNKPLRPSRRKAVRRGAAMR